MKILKTGIISEITTNNGYNIHLPLAIARALKVRKGDNIEYCLGKTNDEIIIKKYKK